MMFFTEMVENLSWVGDPSFAAWASESKQLKWRAQGDDFRTFIDNFVASLPQAELSAGRSL